MARPAHAVVVACVLAGTGMRAAASAEGTKAGYAVEGLAQANRLIDDADFEGALAALQVALGDESADARTRVELYHRLGEVNVILDRPDTADAAFARLFELAPGFTTPAEDPPSVREPLRKAREAASAARTPVTLTLEKKPPASVEPGADVPLVAKIPDLRSVLSARLYYRAAGSTRWEATTLHEDDDGRYAGVLPAKLFATAGASADYYLQVEDVTGAKLAGAGSAEHPLRVGVRAAPPPVPVYERWWFWTGAGALVAIGGTVAYFAFSRPSTGSVTVAVRVQ